MVKAATASSTGRANDPGAGSAFEILDAIQSVFLAVIAMRGAPKTGACHADAVGIERKVFFELEEIIHQR